ncbi:MAG: DUF2786 domain-containing protein [bacterium]|nr:DUF2786 domain-containing protein [bacterium]
MITNQNNNISDDLVHKIKALLRLATSSNEHEANLAMSRAKSLCVKYEIEMCSLDAYSDGKPKANEPIIQDNVKMGNRFPISQNLVSNILNKFFNVRVLYGGGRSWGRHITLIGRKLDIELATYINQHLNNEFLRLWRNFYTKNESNGVTLKDRSGFMIGLSQGLSEKLAESQKNAEQESFTTTVPIDRVEQVKQTYALAIINLRKNIDEKTAEFYPHLRKNYSRTTVHNYNSLGAGRVMGKTISVNRPLNNNSTCSQLND